jgi:hypothetical protein
MRFFEFILPHLLGERFLKQVVEADALSTSTIP